MAKSGRIEAADLLDEKAILVFEQLAQKVKETNAEISKLKANNAKLAAGGLSTANSEKVQENIRKNLEKINKLKQQNLDLELKALGIQQRAANLRKTEISQLTKAQSIYKGIGVMALKITGTIAVVQRLWASFNQVADVILKIDSFNNLMTKTTGTIYGASDAMAYLIKTSKDFGISLDQAIQRYSKFYAAATQAGLAGEEIRGIFTGMAKVSGNLGLRADELSGVFLALEQMLSKGKVTTEELRRQLGERMPGAVGIMVRALNALNPEMKITTDELDSLLKKGKVISAEVLPEFARQAQIAFGVLDDLRTDTLVADMERMNTSWIEFVYSVERGGGLIGESISFVTNTFTEFFEKLTYNEKAQSIMDTNELWAASTYQLVLDIAKLLPYSRMWAKRAQEDFDQAIKARAELADSMREYDDLYSSVLKLRIEAALLADEELDSDAELLKIKQLTNKELKDEIELRTKRNKLIADAKSLTAYTIAWWENEKKIAEEALNEVTSIDPNTPEALAARKRIQEASDAIDKIRGKIKKGKAAKEFELEFVNPETLNGLKETVKILRELAGEAENSATREEYMQRADALQREVDLMEHKIDLEEYLNEIYAEREKQLDDEAWRDDQAGTGTFATATTGIANAMAPGLTGFQSQMPIWLEEYKKLYGEDLTNWEGFLKEKLEKHLEYMKDAAEVDRQIIEDQAEARIQILQAAQAVIGSIFEFVDALHNQQLENIRAEIKAEEDKYDRLLELANDDKDATDDLNRAKADSLRKLEKEELKIRQRQARYDKAQALFDIALNTAVGISAAFIQPWQIAVIAALGAIQAATVLAQPIPQYKHGRKGGPAELAIVGDGGKSEVVVGKKGAYLTPATSTLTALDKGDRVFSSFMDYQRWLNNSLDPNKDNGIEKAIEKGFAKAKVNNFIKQPNIKIDLKHASWLLKNTDF